MRDFIDKSVSALFRTLGLVAIVVGIIMVVINISSDTYDLQIGIVVAVSGLLATVLSNIWFVLNDIRDIMIERPKKPEDKGSSV